MRGVRERADTERDLDASTRNLKELLMELSHVEMRTLTAAQIAASLAAARLAGSPTSDAITELAEVAVKIAVAVELAARKSLQV